MSRAERHGVIIALREMQGYQYLGNGRWKEPEWVIENRANAERARRAK